MDLKEVAILLNGREYGNEITPSEEILLRKEGIVIVFGASDDLMEFRGAIDGEVDCYEGGETFLTKDGLLDICDCECKHFLKAKEKTKIVESVWDKDGYAWTYKTEIPHETFEILEERKKYCRGIAFYLKDCR